MQHDETVMSRTRINLKGLSRDRLETLSGIVAQGGIARAADGGVRRGRADDPQLPDPLGREGQEGEPAAGFQESNWT